MKKVQIKNINFTQYTLTDEKEEYIVSLEFLGEKKPKVGDVLYISDTILLEKNHYCFGSLGSVYSKNDGNTDEIIKVVSEEGEYYLQRYYG